MSKSKGFGLRFGERYNAADTEIENNRKAQESVSVVGVSSQPRNRRFCESCKKYKPRVGVAVKPWHCADCRAKAGAA